MFTHIVRKPFPFVSCLLITACAARVDDSRSGKDDRGEKVATSQEALNGAQPVLSSDPWWQYAVYVQGASGTCTGTIIDPTHVLTAAHCNIQAGGSIGLYQGDAVVQNISVTAAYYYPGADSTHTWQDDAERDLAVLELASPVPSNYQSAGIPTWDLSNGTQVVQVGRGRFDGYDNQTNQLRWRYNTKDTDFNTSIWTDDTVDHGDSGGPILTNESGSYWVHGVADTMNNYNASVDLFKKYTSYANVRFSASFIKNLMTQRELVGVGSNRCLDVQGFGSANGSPLQLWDCHGTPNQIWTLRADGSVVNASGKCLDVTNFGTANGSPVELWDCSGNSNQLWTYASNGQLMNTGSGRCLDVTNFGTGNGSQLEIWDCHDQSNQRWNLVDAAFFPFELVGGGSGRCVDVSGGAIANGSTVQLWDCHRGGNQRWTLQPDGTVVGAGSGRCLDVTNFGTANGSPVELWDCSGNYNQQWTYTSDGRLINSGSGRCLDIKNAGTGNGSGLQIWDCTGQSNQLWTLSF